MFTINRGAWFIYTARDPFLFVCGVCFALRRYCCRLTLWADVSADGAFACRDHQRIKGRVNGEIQRDGVMISSTRKTVALV